ncbi:MAG: hypothetical protein WBF06_03460 [Candidatus Acidiferrales bacterium]
MSWEIFTRRVRRSGSPNVTFNKLGRLAFNKSATAILEKDAVEYVLLMWDAAKHQLGVRPISKKDSRAYALAYGKKGNGAGFSAKTFMDYIGYDRSESRSYPAKWDESESMFVAEIPEEHLQANKQPLLAVGFVGKRTK